MNSGDGPRERQVWLWRAGRGAKDAGAWVDRDLAFIGWEDVGDLTEARDREAIKKRVQATYPDKSAQQIGHAAGQLLRFAVEAQEGDFVVMPWKGSARVAIGRIAGSYRYEDVDGAPHHARRVDWDHKAIPTDSLGGELATKIKSAAELTVQRLGGATEAAALGVPRLIPLPAADRATSYPLPLDKILGILEFVADRCPREEVLAHIRDKNPGQTKEHSVRAHLTLAAEPLGVMRIGKDEVKLTDRGSKFLESRNPDVLQDHILTAMFGIDHLLVKLETEPLDKADLPRFSRHINPKQKTVTTISRWAKCLESLGVITSNPDRKLTLTERGRLWRDAIHWTPETLADEQDLQVSSRQRSVALQVPTLADILARIEEAARPRLAFKTELIEALHLGLWSDDQRHFAILAGLSGSGKTKLAELYASAVTGAESRTDNRLCVVSAEPGWHDHSQLLGYVNPLDGWYVETKFQRLLVNAAENPKEIHACVLDEMNLSHPEQYLAPLLSAMERVGGPVDFHTNTDDEEVLGVPAQIPYPPNLVLIGTVNMDETTMGIADKTLDRAFTLEFWDIEVDDWPGWTTCKLPDGERDTAKKVLNELMEALKPARLHFGWRVIEEIVRFLERRTSDAASLGPKEALDEVVYAKVLPKLRGDDSPRFRTALEKSQKVLADAKLDRSARKVTELIEDLDETGSFRFWR